MRFIATAGGFNLHFDEAQYWEWSQQLDWSYYSKGPLIAWLIALSTALFGQGEWQVRLFVWLAYDVFLLLLFCFAHQFWQNRRAGWWAVALGLTAPLYFSLGQVMTTGCIYSSAWPGPCRQLWQACADSAMLLGRLRCGDWHRRSGQVQRRVLPFFLGLGLLLVPTGRHALRRWPPWGGVLLALLILSPVLLWNATAMFGHEQGHVLGVTKTDGSREDLADL